MMTAPEMHNEVRERTENEAQLLSFLNNSITNANEIIEAAKSIRSFAYDVAAHRVHGSRYKPSWGAFAILRDTLDSLDAASSEQQPVLSQIRAQTLTESFWSPPRSS